MFDSAISYMFWFVNHGEANFHGDDFKEVRHQSGKV